MNNPQKSVTIRRVIQRLMDPFGRKSLLRELRDRFRPSHAKLLVDESDSLPDFWERAHASSTHLWISGTPPKEIYERLNISELVSENKFSILNVGVGEGYCEADLSNKGHSVDALDISQSALRRVHKHVRKGFLSARDLPTNSYDLIVHHLVAQHMSHKDLEEQVTHLIRSLKKNGLIAMQFASSQRDHTLVTSDENKSVVMSGGVLRSKNSIQEIATHSSGRIQNFFDKEDWSNSECRYVTAHIVKI